MLRRANRVVKEGVFMTLEIVAKLEAGDFMSERIGDGHR